jgi:hypothetical protein
VGAGRPTALIYAAPANLLKPLVVGNVPFGSHPVHDPVHTPHGCRIHDYFFARALACGYSSDRALLSETHP